MEVGTRIKVLWYCVKNGKHSTGNIIRPKPASNEMIASWVNPIKNGGGNIRKRSKTCPSKKHSTGTVLALSSSFVNRETGGKVFVEA